MKKEVHVPMTHEQVVVLNADGPVRSEAKFKARPYRAAPTSFAAVVDSQPSRKIEDPVFVADNRSATLHIEQHVIPGIADLAREQAECIKLGFILDACKSEVGVGALEIGPVALRLQAKLRVGYLPAIVDLTADRASRRIMATLCRRAERQSRLRR